VGLFNIQILIITGIIIITVNGRGDTVIMGLQDYYQMKSELELLRTLAEAEEDIADGRVP